MEDHEYYQVVVESYIPVNRPGLHGDIHIRPISGQDPFTPDMHVECSKKLSEEYPVGTRFLIKAKITSREGGRKFAYSHYRWAFKVLDDKTNS